jgi:hypothetical protein
MVPEWQQRVLDEASDLETKLKKLNDYLDIPVEVISGSPAAEHRRLLVNQAAQMRDYLATLQARIKLFPELG